MYKNAVGRCSLVLLALILLAAIGCGGVAKNTFMQVATPTPTPIPSPTPIPTPTPTPTPVPTPTPIVPPPTPTPSPTPTPIPTPTPVTMSAMVFVGSSLSGGLTVFRLHPDGTLAAVQGDGTTGNPLPSALAHSGGSLVMAQQLSNSSSAQVQLFTVNRQTGGLSLTGTASIPATVPDALNGPETLMAAMSDEFAYIGTANGIYGFSLANGNLVPVPGSPFQKTNAANPARLSAYSHLRLKDTFLIAAHGTTLQAFQIGADGELIPRGEAQTNGSLAGMEIDPADRWVYGSFAGKLVALPFNSASGTFGTPVLSPVTNQSPGASKGRIAASPSGKFLYQTYDDQPAINVYAVDQQTGKITFSSQVTAEDFGKGIALDPNGKFLIATSGDDTGQHTLVYSVNETTGGLTRLPGTQSIGSTTKPIDILTAIF
jgi:Lactonase, 7-bladed beta-propeller